MKKFILLSSIFILILTGIFFISCDISNPMDDFTLKVDLPEESQITLMIYDAGTNDLITENVIITIAGEDFDKATDVAYESISAMETSSGVTSFLVNSNYLPTEEEPISYSLVFESDNYVSTSKLVNLSSIGSRTYAIYMINQSNPPEGVSVVQNTEINTDANGAISSDVVITSSVNDNAAAELSVPAGTQFTTANGTPLTGQLTTTLCCYDGTTQAATNAIPQNITSEDGDLLDVFSMVDIQIMDEHGNVAGTGNALGKKSGNMILNRFTLTVIIPEDPSEPPIVQASGLGGAPVFQSIVPVVNIPATPTRAAIRTVTAQVPITAQRIVVGLPTPRCGNSTIQLLKPDGTALTSQDLGGNTPICSYSYNGQTSTPAISYSASKYYIDASEFSSKTVANFKILIGNTEAYNNNSVNLCSLGSQITLTTIPAVNSQKFQLKLQCGDTETSLPAANYTYSCTKNGTEYKGDGSTQGGKIEIPSPQEAEYTVNFSVSISQNDGTSKIETGTVILDLTTDDVNKIIKSAVYDGKTYTTSSTDYSINVSLLNDTYVIVFNLSQDKCTEYNINF